MTYRKRLNCLGSSCQISVFSPDGEGEELVRLCHEELLRIEARFGTYHADSLINQLINLAGSDHFTPLDSEARSLFEFVSALWKESSHLFDPTTRLLEDCYTDDGRLRATRPQLDGLLKLVGWSKLEITEEGARLPAQGMLIGLDSCIRPYALDCVKKLLLRSGIEHAHIEMEREAVSIGKQSDGANWLQGIRHPYGGRTAITRVKLNGKGYAMRGDFERRIRFGEEVYGRGLSPVDGLPIPGLLSVSVVADNCLSACSAANIARLKTEQSGMNWLQSLGLPWMAIDRSLRSHGPLAPAY